MVLDAIGGKPPQYGLIPPGVIADWNTFQYYFYSNGMSCAGLQSAGKALKAIGYPDADSFIQEARDYKNDILRAYPKLSIDPNQARLCNERTNVMLLRFLMQEPATTCRARLGARATSWER